MISILRLINSIINLVACFKCTGTHRVDRQLSSSADTPYPRPGTSGTSTQCPSRRLASPTTQMWRFHSRLQPSDLQRPGNLPVSDPRTASTYMPPRRTLRPQLTTSHKARSQMKNRELPKRKRKCSDRAARALQQSV